MSAAEKKTVFRIATVLDTMRQRITATVQSDIAQKLKQIPMKIPVNSHYYSLLTENVDSMCQTKTAGRGWGSLRPGDLGVGWTTLQTKQGGSLRPRLWGG